MWTENGKSSSKICICTRCDVTDPSGIKPINASHCAYCPGWFNCKNEHGQVMAIKRIDAELKVTCSMFNVTNAVDTDCRSTCIMRDSTGNSTGCRMRICQKYHELVEINGPR